MPVIDILIYDYKEETECTVYRAGKKQNNKNLIRFSDFIVMITTTDTDYENNNTEKSNLISLIV